MDQTVAIVCHAFLDKCSPEKKEALSSYLSLDLAKELHSLPKTLGDPSIGFLSYQEGLDQIHYSWFEPFLRGQSESELCLFLGCLEGSQVQGLKKLLLFSNSTPQLPPIAASFFKAKLFVSLKDKDLLPISCLPQSPLNSLLDLSHQELLSLIELLSMHDLAIEIRHIIDTMRLKKIYSFLNKAQQSYLKTLSHKKEPIAFKKLGLNNWNGDTEALQASLEQRGINRIAKALFSHHPSLTWHVSHHLDMNRGMRLIHLCSPLNHPQADAILTHQVSDLVHSTLTPKNPT